MKQNRGILQPIAYGIMCIIAIFLLNEDYYNEVIKHPSNTSAVSTGGKLFCALMYFIDKRLGLVGIYVFFTLLALFFFLIAYSAYKKK